MYKSLRLSLPKALSSEDNNKTEQSFFFFQKQSFLFKKQSKVFQKKKEPPRTFQIIKGSIKREMGDVILFINDTNSKVRISRCRICHEEEEESFFEVPCACSGTVKVKEPNKKKKTLILKI